MSARVLQDAFGHHVWATLGLMEVCSEISPEQLETSVPGTYGSILDTMRHLVAGDASYLYAMTGGSIELIDEEAMGLRELRVVMEGHRAAWEALLDQDIDPATVVVRRRDDGSETHVPMGIRLAQALHHGTDHRSQICTALTTLGIQPPDIDVWDFAWHDGRLVEVPAKS